MISLRNVYQQLLQEHARPTRELQILEAIVEELEDIHRRLAKIENNNRDLRA
tara:strand:- start:616 stop:771 length:156 start_codon:yes stop_codon:yes gene_type:complete